MTNALQARNEMQIEAKAAIRKANYYASIIVSVGGGKGKIMIDLAQELIDKGLVKTILYVCDNTRLRDSDVEGFPEQIKTWGSPELKKMTTLECYQTTYKWKDKNFDLILGDEVDFAITPEYVKVFFNNSFKYKILVSGTLSPAKKEVLVKIAPIVYTLKTTEAENRGIVNKTFYYKYNYKMSDDESNTYRKWTRAIANAIEAEKPQDTINYFLSQRKNLISTLDSSYLHTKKVLKFIQGKKADARTVIFCERTEQADRVCADSYHGKNDKENKLKAFQDGDINTLSVVSKITRGINLKKANIAIFEMLGGKSETAFGQRNGRMKRLDVNDMAIVIFMIPWYKRQTTTGEMIYVPTIADSWVDASTKSLNPDFKTMKI